MDTKPTIKNFLIVIMPALLAVFVIFFLVMPKVRENRENQEENRENRENKEENKENQEKIIGGERDAYNCLGPAGFTYNKELDACVREWELENDTQRQAVKTAIEYLPVDPSGNRYTVAKLISMRCPGCFMLTMELNGERTKVTIDNWEVIETSEDMLRGDGDATAGPVGMSPEACTGMSGRVVNIVGDETCRENEALIGDVVGFISPNICCLPNEEISQIDSFEKCANAGFPIMESYPMQCRTPNGKTFTQEIVMSEKVARSIAETSDSCMSEGSISALETHNTDTQTWWFTLEPNEPKQECKPACVVSEKTQTAEINWRCMGLIIE